MPCASCCSILRWGSSQILFAVIAATSIAPSGAKPNSKLSTASAIPRSSSMTIVLRAALVSARATPLPVVPAAWIPVPLGAAATLVPVVAVNLAVPLLRIYSSGACHPGAWS